MASETEHRSDHSEDDVSLYLNCCGEFALPIGGWSRLLSFGQQYGWNPTGTEAPDQADIYEGDLALIGDLSEWDGRYFPGYGQHVTESDARALAAALVRALPDLPEHDAFERIMRDHAAEDNSSQDMPCPKVDRSTSSFELYSGKWKEVLRWFITHCLECPDGLWIWSYEERAG